MLLVQASDIRRRALYWGVWGVASRHADQHEQPGVGVRKSKAVKRGGRAGGVSNGDEKEGA